MLTGSRGTRQLPLQNSGSPKGKHRDETQNRRLAKHDRRVSFGVETQLNRTKRNKRPPKNIRDQM